MYYQGDLGCDLNINEDSACRATYVLHLIYLIKNLLRTVPWLKVRYCYKDYKDQCTVEIKCYINTLFGKTLCSLQCNTL